MSRLQRPFVPVKAPRRLIARALGFLLIFCVLQLSWQALQGTSLEHFIIHDCTVRPAALLANILTPGVDAQAVEFRLQAPGGGLNILNGCEGTETLLLLLAAFAVAPLSWASRGTGVLWGILVVFCINQARILILFYAFRRDHALFDSLHSLVTPIAVVLLVAGYFYGWLAHADRKLSAAV